MTDVVDVVRPSDEEREAAPPGTLAPESALPGVAPLPLPLIGAAAMAAAAGAGWMSAGVFGSGAARAVGVFGPAVGAAAVVLAARSRRSGAAQYLAPAAVVVVGLAVTVPAAGSVSAVPGLVAEAVTLGGVGLAPVPFDPGWRFLLCVLGGLLAVGAASVSASLARPKLAALIPLPVTAGAALLQPAGATEVSGLVALAFTMAGFALAFAAEQTRDRATSRGVEARRLGRSAAVMGLCVGLLLVLSRTGLLVPDPKNDRVVPPTRPESPPPARDRLLFSVTATGPGPWRVGVLDVYADQAWLLPPYDNGRFQPAPTGAAAPDAQPAEFEIADVTGRSVPSPPGLRGITGAPSGTEIDPRTQLLRLPNRAAPGTAYTTWSRRPPTAQELTAAPAPGPEMAPFLSAPPPPGRVQELLDSAPTTNSFDRLQFVRDALYRSVVASGVGRPVDLPPSRVAEMLDGAEATPYEITAAEALLARWAGIPARMGFGYYGGQAKDAGDGRTRWEVRPADGRTYLEAYFETLSWVPIVGVPAQAKSSLSDQDQRQEPLIKPTDELLVQVFVPVRLASIKLLFERIRYLASIVGPLVLIALLVFLFFPAVLKEARRVRRITWAGRHGPHERVLVAYAELRDAAADLNIDGRHDTPLEFVERLDPDEDHRELAWLATRALWGDLQRGLESADADAAESLGRSLLRRLRSGQPPITRVVGAASRTSLREPYLTTVPNLWPGGRRRAARLRPGARPALAAAGALAVAALLAAGVVVARGPADAGTAPPAPDPEQRIFAEVGDRFEISGITFERQPQLEDRFGAPGAAALTTGGRIYTVKDPNGATKGFLEVGILKPEFPTTRKAVKDGITGSIAAGAFRPQQVAGQEILVQDERRQRYVLVLPDTGDHFLLLVVRRDLDVSAVLAAAIPRRMRGEDVRLSAGGVVDRRRGAPL